MQAVIEGFVWLSAHPAYISVGLTLVTTILHLLAKPSEPDEADLIGKPIPISTVPQDVSMFNVIQHLIERRIAKVVAANAGDVTLPSAVLTDVHSAVTSELGDLPTKLTDWIAYLEKFIALLPEIEAVIAKIVAAFKAGS